MGGLYGDLVVKNVCFGWGGTQALVEVIGGWDLLSWEDKTKLRDYVRKKQAEEREKKKVVKDDKKEEGLSL